MLSDLRFACRQLTKSAEFSTVGLITLARGIGLNTSMFSLMKLLSLKPLPYPESSHLTRIYRTRPKNDHSGHSAADYLDLAREISRFAPLGAFGQWSYTLTPERQASAP